MENFSKVERVRRKSSYQGNLVSKGKGSDL